MRKKSKLVSLEKKPNRNIKTKQKRKKPAFIVIEHN